MAWFSLLTALTAAGRVARALARAEERKAEAKTDAARIEADLRISQLEARRAALIEGPGRVITRIVQLAWALPFVIFNFKVIVWDKVLSLGVTDPLGEFERNVGLVIVSFYFLTVGGASLLDRWRGR